MTEGVTWRGGEGWSGRRDEEKEREEAKKRGGRGIGSGMSAGSKVCKQREGMRDEREQGMDGWPEGWAGREGWRGTRGLSWHSTLLHTQHPHNYARTGEVH